MWRRFRRNLSISLFGSGLALALKHAQTALLARMLSIDDFGRALIVVNLFALLEAFLGLGLMSEPRLTSVSSYALNLRTWRGLYGKARGGGGFRVPRPLKHSL